MHFFISSTVSLALCLHSIVHAKWITNIRINTAVHTAHTQSIYYIIRVGFFSQMTQACHQPLLFITGSTYVSAALYACCVSHVHRSICSRQQRETTHANKNVTSVVCVCLCVCLCVFSARYVLVHACNTQRHARICNAYHNELCIFLMFVQQNCFSTLHALNIFNSGWQKACVTWQSGHVIIVSSKHRNNDKAQSANTHSITHMYIIMSTEWQSVENLLLHIFHVR